MDLLKAVNTVLPHLGEHVVTRVEGARHPTVDLIVAAIDRERIKTLSEGLWFNELTLTLPVNTDGQIDVPTDSIAVYGIDCNVEIDDTKFFDLDKGSRYFDKSIKVKVVRDIPFERLPVNVAQYITYKACIQVYVQDFGYEQALPIIKGFADEAWILLSQENLRKRRYNSQKRTRRTSTHAVQFR